MHLIYECDSYFPYICEEEDQPTKKQYLVHVTMTFSTEQNTSEIQRLFTSSFFDRNHWSIATSLYEARPL